VILCNLCDNYCRSFIYAELWSWVGCPGWVLLNGFLTILVGFAIFAILIRLLHVRNRLDRCIYGTVSHVRIERSRSTCQHKFGNRAFVGQSYARSIFQKSKYQYLMYDRPYYGLACFSLQFCTWRMSTCTSFLMTEQLMNSILQVKSGTRILFSYVLFMTKSHIVCSKTLVVWWAFLLQLVCYMKLMWKSYDQCTFILFNNEAFPC